MGTKFYDQVTRKAHHNWKSKMILNENNMYLLFFQHIFFGDFKRNLKSYKRMR